MPEMHYDNWERAILANPHTEEKGLRHKKPKTFTSAYTVRIGYSNILFIII